jgi:hypothetical protein
MSWDGSAWLFVAVPQSTNPASWTSFTPTWTNLTVGNATQSFVYREENKTMFVSGKITFGSTTSISNNPSIAIPNGRTGSDTVLGSTLRFEDAGNSNFFGQLLVSATNIDLYAITVSSTYPTLATLGSTAPFTWGTNDAIYIACSFRIL